MKHCRKTAIIVAALVATIATAKAEFPDKPVTLIVPFPPGGSTTIVARIVAEKMAEGLKQQIIVDNRGGAAGTIGTKMAVQAKPDGYTIGFGYSGTVAVAPAMYATPPYDIRKDLVPVGRIGAAPSTITVHPSFPAKTMAEFIAYAKANPGKVNYGSAGVGSLNHIAGELLAAKTGIQITHVPYKGSGPAMTDLLGGHVPMIFAPIPTVHSNVQGGQLRMLAVTSAKRSSLAPEIPTVAESGVPGYEAVLTYGIFAPTGTPKPIIDRLNKALNDALATEDVKKRLALEGAEPLPGTPADYGETLDREEKQWSALVKSIGLKAE